LSSSDFGLERSALREQPRRFRRIVGRRGWIEPSARDLRAAPIAVGALIVHHVERERRARVDLAALGLHPICEPVHEAGLATVLGGEDASVHPIDDADQLEARVGRSQPARVELTVRMLHADASLAIARPVARELTLDQLDQRAVCRLREQRRHSGAGGADPGAAEIEATGRELRQHLRVADDQDRQHSVHRGCAMPVDVRRTARRRPLRRAMRRSRRAARDLRLTHFNPRRVARDQTPPARKRDEPAVHRSDCRSFRPKRRAVEPIQSLALEIVPGAPARTHAARMQSTRSLRSDRCRR
jgi:hypothetical protein